MGDPDLDKILVVREDYTVKGQGGTDVVQISGRMGSPGGVEDPRPTEAWIEMQSARRGGPACPPNFALRMGEEADV